MKPQNKYEKLEKIGQGSFGKVYKVRNRSTKEFLCLKEIDLSVMSPKMRKDAENEVKILKTMRHEYILRFVESYKTNGKLNIITEYCPKGDLGKHIRTQIKLLSEEVIMKIFVQVCLGLHYMHSARILHRDVKAMNIFLKKDYEIRIGDFGVAKVLRSEAQFAKTIIGTPYYLSPELCEEKPYNEKNDVWALGCLLYEMCRQTQPFKSNKSNNLKRIIKKGVYKEIPPRYSDKLRRLVGEMLNRNVDERPSMKQILLNAYVQEKMAKLEKERAAREKAMQAGAKPGRKIMSYQRRLYSSRASQSQSRNFSRESQKREKNFTKNKQPKVFVIGGAKKPPRRSLQERALPLEEPRDRTPKMDFARKKSRGRKRNMLDELMGGKKISQILREEDEPGGPARPGKVGKAGLPRAEALARAGADGGLNHMRNALYKKKSRDKRETKGRKAEPRAKKPVPKKAVAKPKRKAGREPPRAAGAFRRQKTHGSRAGKKPQSRGKRKASAKHKKAENFKFILENRRPDKKKFISRLEKEYKKRVQSFQDLDDRFQGLESRAKTPKGAQKAAIEGFLGEGAFAGRLGADVGARNEDVSLELGQRPRESSAVTVRQKEPKALGERRRKIKKDFGQWFSEDYFEHCLKLEGEFGGDAGPRAFPRRADELSEQGREQQIHDIRRDFAKKNVVEEVLGSSESKRIASLNVSSNERLPLTFSNGYTISNKRNKFGHKLKRLLEFGSRVWNRNASERLEFRARPGLNFDEHASSVRMTMFFNRLRRALARMKRSAHFRGPCARPRSESCGSLGAQRAERASRAEGGRLRSVYLTKRLGPDGRGAEDWKRGLEAKGDREESEGGQSEVDVYLNYHNNVLRVMREFLLEKWNEELEELNSRTDPKQLAHNREAVKKRPKIFQPVENRRPKVEQKYVVRKQKKPRASRLQALRRVNNLRKSSAEVGTHVLQEPGKDSPRGSEAEKTSKPQVLKPYPRNRREGERAGARACEEEEPPREMWVGRGEAPGGKLHATFSDIKEEKSIRPEAQLDTREELEMLQRINREQERNAERELQSMLRGKNSTLINDFTQVKDPFKPVSALKRSDTHGAQPYDLQIENVIMSEEELSILEGNAKEDSLEAITRSEKGVLGGLLDIDTRAGDRQSFQPVMKLLGLRKPKYLRGTGRQAKAGNAGESAGDREAGAEPSDGAGQTRESLGASFGGNFEIRRNTLDRPIQMRKTSVELPSKARGFSVDGKGAEPQRPEQSRPGRGGGGERAAFRGILEQVRAMAPEQRKKRSKAAKMVSLDELAPEVSVEKISRRLKSMEREKRRERELLEFQRFHELPPSQEQALGQPKPRKKRTAKKKQKPATKKKRNYLERNKRNLPRGKALFYKNFLDGKPGRDSLDFGDQEQTPLLAEGSAEREPRENRWTRQRDQRKALRADSKHQFFEDIRRSLDKLSLGRDSLEKARRSRDSRERRRGQFPETGADQRAPPRKLSGKGPWKQKNGAGRARAQKENAERAKLNLTHDSFASPARGEKPSFNTGRLTSFLANFNIAENINASLALEPRTPGLKQMTAQPEYKPVLGNKKLSYLTSNARRPPLKTGPRPASLLWDAPKPKPRAKGASFNGTGGASRDKFLQSGIPLSVSQSNSEIYGEQAHARGEGYGFEGMGQAELENLRHNFNSYSDRYSSAKSQDPWNPTIEVNPRRSPDADRPRPPSDVKMNLLRNRKKKLIKRLGAKVDKQLIQGFLGEIFEKFRRVERVAQKDIEKLNAKYFRHFDSRQRRLMPSIYQLIDVEIAIQSSQLKHFT